MTTPHLSDDDVRDLFSDHLEGALDDDTRRAVDAALARSPDLAAEHRAFSQTLEALRALPRVEASDRLVGQVRDRLSAERRAGQDVAGGPPVLPLGRAANDDGARTAPSWWSPLRLVSGLAAAAAVIAMVTVAMPDTAGGPGDMLGAGLADQAVNVVWQAPGLGTDVVAAAAATAGMGRDGDRFVGDRAAAGRFFVELKIRAVAAGSDVSGALPGQAERVVVTVSGDGVITR